MRIRRIRSGASILLVGIAACAHTRPEVVADAGAYVSPKLIGCSGYTPPALPWARAHPVSLEVKVLASGAVDPTWPQYRPTGGFNIQKGESFIDQALSLAPGCVFEPAHRGSEAVQAWTTVSFAFDAAGSD